MTKKNIFFIIPTLLFLISSIFSYLAYKKYTTQYTKAFVASHLIRQRKKIEETDLNEILVPKEYLSDDVYIQKEDIIGKYVKLSFSIPSGSLIYKLSLQENIKDLSNTLLKEDETNYDVFISEVKVNTGSLDVGMNTDIYLTIKDKEKTISDLLLENCRITGFYDQNNKLLNEFDQNSRINIMSLAVSYDSVNLLNKALKIGDLSIIASKKPYDVDVNCKINENSEIMDYLR